MFIPLVYSKGKEKSVDKGILKKKTTWTCFGAIAFGIYLIATGSTESGIQTILAGLGGIFLREGVEKNKN